MARARVRLSAFPGGRTETSRRLSASAFASHVTASSSSSSSASASASAKNARTPASSTLANGLRNSLFSQQEPDSSRVASCCSTSTSASRSTTSASWPSPPNPLSSPSRQANAARGRAGLSALARRLPPQPARRRACGSEERWHAPSRAHARQAVRPTGPRDLTRPRARRSPRWPGAPGACHRMLAG
jgi:hypothetical protein